MYSEDDLLPISALQHLAFCERQWALIHLEGAWSENQLTAQGRQLHDRAHDDASELRAGVRIARGLRLHSLRLGLSGQSDVVEFHPSLGDPDTFRPFPIEYKRGSPKIESWDRVQLCAQALCLEEMLDTAVPAGALYYGKPRRRQQVAFHAPLREETEVLVGRLHLLTLRTTTPLATYAKKCQRCSLYSICLPKTAGDGKSAQAYLRRQVASASKEI